MATKLHAIAVAHNSRVRAQISILRLTPQEKIKHGHTKRGRVKHREDWATECGMFRPEGSLRGALVVLLHELESENAGG